MTTVGYGDRYPVTAGGRAVAAVLMLCGMAFIGVIAAAIAAYFVGENSSTKAKIENSDVLRRLNIIEDMLRSDRPSSDERNPGGESDDTQINAEAAAASLRRLLNLVPHNLIGADLRARWEGTATDLESLAAGRSPGLQAP